MHLKCEVSTRTQVIDQGETISTMKRRLMVEEAVVWKSNNGIILSPEDLRANPIGKRGYKGSMPRQVQP